MNSEIVQRLQISLLADELNELSSKEVVIVTESERMWLEIKRLTTLVENQSNMLSRLLGILPNGSDQS